MPNALAGETSPYLQQHAGNPVNWLPWGPEAFALARAEDRPIFLSIGYSTCHWCHVMARESFENEAIARLLNERFVPVKVDREERPDVDRVYMSYVQTATGHGGWPLSAWLSPDLKPFYGGTYFPPEDGMGRPGFTSVLRAIADGWAKDRARMVAEGDKFLASMMAAAPPSALSDGAEELERRLYGAAGPAFQKAFHYLYQGCDLAHGGFSGAPKFPRAANLSFLIRCAALQGPTEEIGAEAIRMAALTLQKMAGGGIHDHVGGGFHRYSVDEEWLVPHFEKMLYDQAQIAVNALETWQATGDERLAWIVRDILEYVLRDLADPAGGFYSGEDADSERPEGGHGEGAFYVWTAGEIDSALRAKGSPAAELVRLHFGVRAEGNVPPDRDPQREMAGRNILAAAGGLSESARRLGIPLQEASDRLTGALDILREVRARRPRPARDEKVLTAWNGLMISALARAAAAPAESLADRRAAYLEAAGRAARFVREALWDEASRSLFRSWRRFGDHPERSRRADAPGFAEDYADLIQGLLDLYEAGFDPAWLQWADRLQERMDERFWDEASGGYFSSDAGAADIIVRLKDDYDGAEPAPSSVAAMNLFRLEAMLGGGGNAPRRLTGLRTLEAFRARWMEHPEALPQMLCALELALDAPRHVVLAGDPDAPGFRALAEVVRENLGPFRSLMAAPPDAPATADSRSWLASRAPWLAGMRPVDGRPAAYVCENFACRAPVTDPAALRKALAATTEPEGRSR